MPFPWVASSGSEFFHTGSNFRDTIEPLAATDVRVLADRKFLERHKGQAGKEFLLYKNYQGGPSRACPKSLRHFVLTTLKSITTTSVGAA